MDPTHPEGTTRPTPVDIAAVRWLRRRYSVRGLVTATGISRWAADRIVRGLPVRPGTLLAVRVVVAGRAQVGGPRP